MTKTIAVLLTSAVLASAQTNFYPLLECKTRIYTNATIDSVTPATVTVFWGGGGEKVAITNLPQSIQRQYHYSAEEAQKYLDGIAAKKAARQALVEKNSAAIAGAQAKRGETQTAMIIKTIGGGVVEIMANGRYIQAYVHGLPPDVFSFIDDYNASVADVEAKKNVNASATVKNRTVNHGVVTYTSTGDPTSYAASAISARQHLADLTRSLPDQITFMAAPTQFMIRPGVLQWEYQGRPANLPDISEACRIVRSGQGL